MKASVDTVTAPTRAASLLHPTRRRILEALREPQSASTVARTMEMPRQLVNYHLRELEKEGFIEELESRRKGNCVERIVRARASHYVMSQELLGVLASDPESIEDRYSSAYLVALAGQAIQDLSTLSESARKAKKRLATMSLDTNIRFANAADRNRFAEELATAVAALVEKYHDEEIDGGRWFRCIVGAYPSIRKKNPPKKRRGD